MPRPKVSEAVESPALQLQPIGDGVTASNRVAEAIRHAILSGELRPGQRLVERDLATALGISKTPVREALKILSRSGLVTATANYGATVRTVDAEMARRVYEARLLVEPPAVRWAVPFHDDETVLIARRLLEDAAAAAARADQAALTMLNGRFHRQLYLPSKNLIVRRFLDDLQDQLSLINIVAWHQEASYGEEAQEHEQILDAVANGDADSAERRLRAHIERFASRHHYLDGSPSSPRS
jgi:DNA-binding GntR family transcriptional regulator